MIILGSLYVKCSCLFVVLLKTTFSSFYLADLENFLCFVDSYIFAESEQFFFQILPSTQILQPHKTMIEVFRKITLLDFKISWTGIVTHHMQQYVAHDISEKIPFNTIYANYR